MSVRGEAAVAALKNMTADWPPERIQQVRVLVQKLTDCIKGEPHLIAKVALSTVTIIVLDYEGKKP